MGKPTPTKDIAAPAQQYRDDADDVSMHTTRDDYEYDDVPELPSYADSEAAASSDHLTIPSNEQPPQDEYASLQQPVNGWRQNKAITTNETTIRMDERLDGPEQLYNYLTTYLRLVPPKPAVRLTGYHTQTTYRNNNKKETERITDFDILLRLSAWLPAATPGVDEELVVEEGGWRPRIAANSDRVHRGGWRKMRAKGYKQDIEVGNDPRPELMHWCKEYCDSKAKLKIFRVTRDVPGIDQELLRNQLERLVRSTSYRGHIDISFPISEKHVDIYNPHIINRWRISWVRYLFYFTFLWLITWPILFFMTKRWAVYTVNWCFSWQASDGRGGVVKRYASTTEQAWLDRHANMIRSLVFEKYSGDATDFPLDVQSSNRRGGGGRMPETGNRNVDAAVNAIQGGVSVWNAISRGAGRDVDDWGGDSN